MSNYSIATTLSCGFSEAVEKTRKALADEGFGIITEIDAKATLKKKLDKDFRDYIILGACSPSHAYRALLAETEVGLLLPCNVIVYDAGSGKVAVSAIEPTVAMGFVKNTELAKIAAEVKIKLEKALKSLA